MVQNGLERRIRQERTGRSVKQYEEVLSRKQIKTSNPWVFHLEYAVAIRTIITW